MGKESVMINRRVLGVGVMVFLLAGVGGAQQPGPAQPVDEEEQMDTGLRKFGYISGQAFQCYDAKQQEQAQRVALDVATNILRLFGSDRAFFYAAAFGAGATAEIDKKTCPDAIREAKAVIEKLNALSR